MAPFSTRLPIAAVTVALLSVDLLSVELSAQSPEAPPPQSPAAKPATASQASAARFEFPTDDYQRGLRGRGNFGVLITAKGSPFAGSYHLAEDVWLPAGTKVRSIGNGVVRYSDFSPSWKDDAGVVHWNLGNVIVVEHVLDPPVAGLTHVCSFYVHLGADRRVALGDTVQKGQVLGCIGKDRSEENGLYPAHLHFGLHRGPYHQIPPSWRREVETMARTVGIVGDRAPVRGEVEFVRQSPSSVLVRSKGDGATVLLSLLVGSTAPEHPPADIMAWCSGYGDRQTVDEWLRPSKWIAARIEAESASSPASARAPK